MAAELQPSPTEAGASSGPQPLAPRLRRLRRNRVALAFLGLFVLIVVFVPRGAALGRPRRRHRARTTPTRWKRSRSTAKSATSSPPTASRSGRVWFEAGGKFFLGADGRLGRDEMVRLMYGGRTSLFIGFAAALITTLLAIVLGLLAGYYRGWIDAVISRTMDVIWAFPVLLLGIALGTALAVGGLQLGPLDSRAARSGSRS